MASKLGRVLRRAISFCIFGAFYGAIIGAFNGALIGTTFLTILSGLEATQFGGFMGGIIGTAVGVIVCIPAWILAGAMHYKHEELYLVRLLIRGTLRASLLMTFAGASSGILLHFVWAHLTSNRAEISNLILAPLGIGFFYGSIIGCAFGLFLGAIFGARPVRSWLNVPIGEMPSEIRDGVLRLVQTR